MKIIILSMIVSRIWILFWFLVSDYEKEEHLVGGGIHQGMEVWSLLEESMTNISSVEEFLTPNKTITNIAISNHFIFMFFFFQIYNIFLLFEIRITSFVRLDGLPPSKPFMYPFPHSNLCLLLLCCYIYISLNLWIQLFIQSNVTCIYHLLKTLNSD